MARADPSAWLHQHACGLAPRSASPPSAADESPDALKSSKCCYYYITVLYHAIVYYTTCYYIDIHVDIDDADNNNDDINVARCFSSAAPRRSNPEVPGPRRVPVGKTGSQGRSATPARCSHTGRRRGPATQCHSAEIKMIKEIFQALLFSLSSVNVMLQGSIAKKSSK